MRERERGDGLKEKRLRLSMSMSLFYLFFVSIELIVVYPGTCNAKDAISQKQYLRDGETLISKGGTFELGFFSPGKSTNRYLGIWYKNIPVRTVVWVANRENPIRDFNGVLEINATGGMLVLLSRKSEEMLWSSSSSTDTRAGVNLTAELLDSGNFVLGEEADMKLESYLWQSFDYPSDTLLQGMKLGWDSKRGLNRVLSSWKSPDDPAPGELRYEMTHENYPESLIWKGSARFYRTGPWNGIRFSGAPELKENPLFSYSYVFNQTEGYYTFDLKNTSLISILVLNQTTYSRQRYIWVPEHRAWEVYSSVPRGYCDNYALCGANGICDLGESPVCQCIKGFKPKSPQAWNLLDWSRGCVRRKPLKCQNADGFSVFEWVKLPETTHTWVNHSMSLKECRHKCLANCSCSAYTNSNISGIGSGCVMWFGDLLDIRQSAGGQKLFVRMSYSELEAQKRLKMKWASVAVAAVAFFPGIIIASYYIWKRKTSLREKAEKDPDPRNEDQEEDLELKCFSLTTLADATTNFSADNKLGEGGYGPVYKGILADGQEIAVKRLLINSRQGSNQFKTEATMIAKLQHRNLVKLLGCCVEGEERILIYEYMPNKSLDSFIFESGRLLGWNQRFDIVCGVARGILYLHQDSRLRIIHRDIKASNILLDEEMNPKISDFGLARSFATEETVANTKRIVGTYGYMSPEYAFDGLFSTKSDVFSFGVLLLEIVSGEKNRGFHHPSHDLNLIGHAWKLWKEGMQFDLIDTSCEGCCPSEMLRCIHVGLLCVQQRPKDRPHMSSVVLMLSSDIPMPQPKQPGFFMSRNPAEEADSSTS